MSTPSTPIIVNASSSVTELLRRTQITCNARYHAARRLAAHGSFSQWTLALLAVGQIVISLVEPMGLNSNFKTGYVNFMNIFFGILVLAYSLLLGMANFSARAVKMHGCGLELGRLARQLVELKNSGNNQTNSYDECTKEYYDILDKYENHTRTDYLTSHYEYYDGKTTELSLSADWLAKRFKLEIVRFKLYVLHCLQFSHYAMSTLLISGWIYKLVRFPSWW